MEIYYLKCNCPNVNMNKKVPSGSGDRIAGTFYYGLLLNGTIARRQTE